MQKSLKSTAIDIFGDVSQLGLSELIQWVTSEETVLSDIPVLKWFIYGINTVSSISAVFAVKKYYAFIKPIKDEKFFNSESAHKQIEEIASRFVRNFSEKSHSNQAAFCSFSKSIFCSRRVSALM